MHILGTAGHVDHGKTALIKALTGIDTDRLPEEKSRGLTIDLGFAHFQGPGGVPIGVIDVPGHERFIRNMVAGAWSLDCAILVIAADDGWMQQSSDHLRVLRSMGLTNIIGAITKIDAVPPERAEEVEIEAAVRVPEITGDTIPLFRVSSLTGEGIDSLKAAVIESLSSLPEKMPGNAYLYVDRVFHIRGAGTVVTGSLAGGPLRVGDTCYILPSGERARIRGLQSYYSDVEEARPVSRLACNLQGVTGDRLYRGCCLAAEPEDFFVGDDFFVSVDDMDELLRKSILKNHSECEIAAGTFHTRCTIHHYKHVPVSRIKFSSPEAIRWNQRFILIRHGGSRIIGGGTFLWPWDPEKRDLMGNVLRILPSPMEAVHRCAFELAIKGYLPASEEGPGIVEILTDAVERSGGYVFLKSWAGRMRDAITGLAGKPGGISLQELESSLRIERPVIEALTAPLAAAGTLTLQGRLLFAGSGPSLSPFGRQLLERIRSAGAEGFDPGKENIPGARKELRTIARSGLIVPLENGIYYSLETYQDMVSRILAGKQTGDRFAIPEVKERTSLSRKYSIPVLNRMEQDGFVKREGDHRIVLRIPGN